MGWLLAAAEVSVSVSTKDRFDIDLRSAAAPLAEPSLALERILDVTFLSGGLLVLGDLGVDGHSQSC